MEDKFKRLIVPYLMVGILFMIPVKYFSGFYRVESLVKVATSRMLLSEDSGHLWFLYMLFFVFLVFKLFEDKLAKKKYREVFIILFLIYCFGDKVPTNVMECGRVANYLIWFYMGYLFESKRLYLNEWIRPYKWGKFIGVCIFYLTLLDYVLKVQLDRTQLNGYLSYKVIMFVTVLTGILMCYIFAFNLSSTNLFKFKWAKVLDKYNFDIYLYHDPINYLILMMINRINLWGYFKGGKNYIIFIIIRVVLPIIISISIAIIIRWINKVIKIKCKVDVIKVND